MSSERTRTDADMRWEYVVKRMHDGATRTYAEQEYDRSLAAHDARVKRDAAREALDELADAWDGDARDAADDGRLCVAARIRSNIAGVVSFRRARYPEETPCDCGGAPAEIGGARHRDGCGEETPDV